MRVLITNELNLCYSVNTINPMTSIIRGTTLTKDLTFYLSEFRISQNRTVAKLVLIILFKNRLEILPQSCFCI